MPAPHPGRHFVEKDPVSRPFAAIKKTHSEPNDASLVLGSVHGGRNAFRSRTRGSVMSEVEYDRLLDTVRTAVAAAPQESTFNQPAKVANDNRLASSVNPLPEGCYGAG
jgi:hypothetical protein